jgi:hypothetical protein
LAPFLAVVACLVLGEILLRLAGFTVWRNPLDGSYDSHALVKFDRDLGFRNRRGVSFTSDKRLAHGAGAGCARSATSTRRSFTAR